jgi:hypothetical protein
MRTVSVLRHIMKLIPASLTDERNRNYVRV